MKLTVTTRTGRQLEVAARPGMSIMENMRNAGVGDLLALCGGCCSCATCHVYIDEVWLPVVGTAAGDEDEVLECAAHRRHNSRLACQIEMSGLLDGLRLTVADEE